MLSQSICDTVNVNVYMRLLTCIKFLWLPVSDSCGILYVQTASSALIVTMYEFITSGVTIYCSSQCGGHNLQATITITRCLHNSPREHLQVS